MSEATEISGAWCELGKRDAILILEHRRFGIEARAKPELDQSLAKLEDGLKTLASQHPGWGVATQDIVAMLSHGNLNICLDMDIFFGNNHDSVQEGVFSAMQAAVLHEVAVAFQLPEPLQIVPLYPSASKVA